jgi:hypothetical protein
LITRKASATRSFVNAVVLITAVELFGHAEPPFDMVPAVKVAV